MAIKQKLSRFLQDWVKAGLISPAQNNAILAYESARERRFNPLAWLAAAGGLCMALGSILVISHNWEHLGSLLKQASFVLLLALTAFASSRYEDRPWLGPGLMLAWLFLPLAGIGLWGQVYHLSGDALKPLLAWLVLTLPIAWMAKHEASAVVHTAGLVAAAYVGAFWPGTWLELDALHEPDLLRWSLRFLGLMGIWALAAWQAQNKLETGGRVALLLCAAVFMAALGFADTPLQCRHAWLAMLMVSGLGVLFWFGCWAWGLRGTRLRELGMGLSGGLTYALSFTRYIEDSGSYRSGGLAWALLWAMAGLGLAILGPWQSMQLSRRWVGPFTALLPMTLIGLGLLGLPGWSVGVLANFALAALCVVWMFESAALGERGLLNKATFFLGLLIFTRFVDYFGSLLRSGTGFIIAGLAFFALAKGLNKGRKALIDNAAKGGRS